MISKISGIYAYHDNLKDEIIYIGKDSNIERNRRHKQHYYPSRRDEQQINRVLQNNNSGRYTYVVLEKGYFTDDELNQKEISWISFFNPKFNFTEGGEGIRGHKHSEETRKKMSEAVKGENNPNYGKKFSKETRKKMSENHADFSGENNPMYGRIGEKNSQFNPCIKIRKQKNKKCKQGFFWRAQPCTPEKRIIISSVDLQKCIEKVENFIKSNDNVYGYTDFEIKKIEGD